MAAKLLLVGERYRGCKLGLACDRFQADTELGELSAIIGGILQNLVFEKTKQIQKRHQPLLGGFDGPARNSLDAICERIKCVHGHLNNVSGSHRVPLFRRDTGWLRLALSYIAVLGALQPKMVTKVMTGIVRSEKPTTLQFRNNKVDEIIESPRKIRGLDNKAIRGLRR